MLGAWETSANEAEVMGSILINARDFHLGKNV